MSEQRGSSVVNCVSPRQILCFAIGVVCFCIGVAYAAAPAGTVIKNQASASYRDADGVLRFTTSNIVETLIQQVAAVELVQDQSRSVMAGRQVFLPHTISNSGNGADVFNLAVTNSGSDSFDVGSLKIYADSDQNGLPDLLTPVTVTPLLDIQQSWSFVVGGQVPTGVPAGDVAILEVSAESTFDSSITALNNDSLTVSVDAVIELVKSLSSTSGYSPDGPFTVTLGYRNTGAGDASDLVLIDALPPGMEYVDGSARWSVTGDTVLSDDNSGTQGGTDVFIDYCAYDSSCSAYPEANADADLDSTNQITAIISTVAPGESGQLTFDVEIADGLNASALFNTAEVEYTTNAVLIPRQASNTVAFKVLHQPSVVLNGSVVDSTDGVSEPFTIASIGQGGVVSSANVVWNAGNDTDTFDITLDQATSSYPAGSVFRLLQSDGITPLLDSNANGIPDTGPMAPGSNYSVVVQVVPPANAIGDNGGAGYQIVAVATSAADSLVFNDMLNRLLNISIAGVDITNDAPLPDAEASGSGTGPEVTPVSTFTATPGETVSIDLYINNTGQLPIDLVLMASTVADFSDPSVPDGWAIEFRTSGEEAAISSTGMIEAGAFKLVTAQITVPADATQQDVSVYFQALSELTGAVDIKHDQISVTAVPELMLDLDQDGQTGAGGSYTYTHTLRNSGNVSVSNINLSTAETVTGWSSVIYEDTNGDGVLGASDQALSSIASLGIDASVTLFVKVFAPTGVAPLTTNLTTLTASWSGGVDTIKNIDTTTVASVEVNIVKEQAPDYGCTGTLDGPYGVGGFSVEPGNNCVSYRLTATNAGQASAFNVEIADATPAFTAYFGAASCSHGTCTVAEPASGGQGNVVASIPELGAGDFATLNFSVRVE